MIISVMNHSALTDAEVQVGIRAVNRQIAEDFAPHWGLSATLRLDGSGRGATMAAMRGDAILHLHDRTKGFHFETMRGVPYGVVFTELHKLAPKQAEWLGWTAILSHEALELLADPFNNLLVKGPHPEDPQREVFHYREVCDPVQMQFYQVDGVTVSDFVLPRYYNVGAPPGGHNDFLGTRLKVFKANPGGYVGFWDPRVGRYGHYEMWPRYRPHEAPEKVRRAKGLFGRLNRYATPHVRRHSR